MLVCFWKEINLHKHHNTLSLNRPILFVSFKFDIFEFGIYFVNNVTWKPIGYYTNNVSVYIDFKFKLCV